MSETPTLPVPDEQTLRELETTRNYNMDENDRKFASWQHGVEVPSFTRSAEAFDLERDDTLNDSLWSSEEEYRAPVALIERIQEAQRPMTRPQEVESSLFPLTDKQLLAYAIANTNAVWALKHLA